MTGPRPEEVGPAGKMLANIRHLRSKGASEDRIKQEIAHWAPQISQVSAKERRLNPAERLAGASSRIASGFTLGTFDEAAGLLGEDTKNEQRFLQKQIAEEQPDAAIQAEVIGSLANPLRFLKPAARTASAVVKVGKVLGEGAIQGGIAGAANAEGDVMERLEGAGKGAALGSAAAGAIGGVVKGASGTVRNVLDRFGMKAPAVERTMEKMADALPDEDIAAARANLDRLRGRNLAHEATVADVLPEGEGALRQAATSNREVRKTVDKELRGRMNRLANEADDRFSQYTGTQRQSERKSIEALNEESSKRAAPLYKQAAEEFGAGDETVKSAALRAPDGTVVEGSWHGDAWDNARRTKAFGSDLDINFPPLEEGFTTSSGRFVSRKEAMELARKTGRVDPKKMAEFDDGGQLHADMVRPAGKRLAASERAQMQEMGIPADRLPPADAIDEALELPFVQQRIDQLRRAPRSKFAKVADDSFEMMDQVYKDIGKQIRSLDRKDWALKSDLMQQRAVLLEAITSRSPTYSKALSEFADPQVRREAFEQGASRSPADVIPSQLADLDQAGASSFKEGKAALLRQDVPNLDIGEYARFNDVLGPVSTREKVEVFRATFGDQAYKEYVTDLLEMAGLQRMKAGAGESTTIDKLMEQLQAEPEALVGLVGQMLRGNPMAAVAQFSPKGQIGAILDNLRRNQSAGQRADFLLQRGDDKVKAALDLVEKLRREGKLPRKRNFRETNPLGVVSREAGAIVGRP